MLPEIELFFTNNFLNQLRFFAQSKKKRTGICFGQRFGYFYYLESLFLITENFSKSEQELSAASRFFSDRTIGFFFAHVKELNSPILENRLLIRIRSKNCSFFYCQTLPEIKHKLLKKIKL